MKNGDSVNAQRLAPKRMKLLSICQLFGNSRKRCYSPGDGTAGSEAFT